MDMTWIFLLICDLLLFGSCRKVPNWCVHNHSESDDVTLVTSFLTSFINSTDWSSALFLTDKQDDELMDACFDKFHDNGITTVRASLNPYENNWHNDVWLWIKDKHGLLHEDERVGIMLLASPETVSRMFDTTLQIERNISSQGVLTMETDWLIVTWDDGDSRALDIDQPVPFLHLVLLVLRENGSLQYYTSIPKRSGDRIFWGLENASYWRDGGLTGSAGETVVHHVIFPNRNCGFCGMELKVTTLEWPYFVEKREADGRTLYMGLCFEVLEAIAQSLNFSFTVTEPPDGLWGDNNNGTWNGLVGYVAYGGADLLAAPSAITNTRETVLDYSYPFYTESFTALYLKPDGNQRWSVYLDPYKMEVWGCVAVGLIVTAVSIMSLARWAPEIIAQDDRRRFGSFLHALWLTYGSLLQQGSPSTPRTLSLRFVVGFWWFFSIVVIATYTGNLIAFLTVERDVPAFRNLQDLANAVDRMKFGTLDSTSLTSLFRDLSNTSQPHRQIWTQMQQTRIDDPEVLSKEHEDHIDRVLRGSYVYINDATSFAKVKSTNCSLEILPETLIVNMYGFAVANGSSFGKSISRKIQQAAETGLLIKWKRMWWPKRSNCPDKVKVEAKCLTLKDVQGAFYVYALMLLAAWIMLIIEKAVSRLSGKWRRMSGTPEKS